MPAKFSGLRVAAGDVHVFYGPCGGGFGEPLERPAAKVLDDVLDGFCTVEHARLAYGVVVDLVAETVDEGATQALRERMGAAPQGKTTATAEPPRARAMPGPPTQRAGGVPSASSARPTRPAATSRPVPPAVTNGNGRSRTEVLRGLREAYGDAWSFEIVGHSAYGGTIKVVGQLRANGATVRETAAMAAPPGRSLGELLERAANDSLRKCVETLMRNGH
jgi:hypothetical protein